MAEERTLMVQEKADAPVQWGDRKEVWALAKRLQKMLPGSLTEQESLLLAQYSAVMDANPFRGEIYAYHDWQGKVQFVEGYKLLVRWARRQCNFYDKYEAMRDLPEGDIGFIARILREDAQKMLKVLTQSGADWKEAYEIVTQTACGVVKHQETVYNKDSQYHKKGDPLAPPKGWTWEQVARKRALKNALNIAYGAPSPKEMSRESWMVEDTPTTADDWAGGEELKTPDERATLAKLNAQEREYRAKERSVDAATAIAELFGDDDDPLSYIESEKLTEETVVEKSKEVAEEPEEEPVEAEIIKEPKGAFAETIEPELAQWLIEHYADAKFPSLASLIGYVLNKSVGVDALNHGEASNLRKFVEMVAALPEDANVNESKPLFKAKVQEANAVNEFWGVSDD